MINLSPSLSRRVVDLVRDEQGQDLVEYSLLIAFIAIAAVAILRGTSGSIRSVFTTANTALANGLTGVS